MQINITINPTYQHLSDFIESLPSIFETEGELVYDERNQVRYFTIDGMKLVAHVPRIAEMIHHLVRVVPHNGV